MINIRVVGMQGIEPCTTCTQNKHATDTPHPEIYNNVIVILFTLNKFLSNNTVLILYLM